jgi:hypothetical protein
MNCVHVYQPPPRKPLSTRLLAAPLRPSRLGVRMASSMTHGEVHIPTAENMSISEVLHNVLHKSHVEQ